MLRQGREHTLASVDAEWLERMSGAGRFPSHAWSRAERIRVSTLDAAIAAYGEPRFVKIDVEGHEAPVLRGLHRPVQALSFEFASEALDRAKNCLALLCALEDYEFNVSLGETMVFDDPRWIDQEAMAAMLDVLVGRDTLAWGDIYARRR